MRTPLRDIIISIARLSCRAICCGSGDVTSSTFSSSCCHLLLLLLQLLLQLSFFVFSILPGCSNNFAAAR
jgi:hypothetical protein